MNFATESREPVGLRLSRKDVAAASLLAAATVLAMVQLWQPGVPSAVDFIAAIYRAYELELSIAGGTLFPRVGMGLNFDYSAPLFNYYAPLPSYAILAVHWVGLGYVEAGKAVSAGSLLVGALGAYVYARWLFGDRLSALTSGLASIFAPYLLLNIYERGALAEIVALSFVPWLFWSFHRLLSPRGSVGIVQASAVLALIVLSHNITAMFAAAFLAAYVGWQVLRARAWGCLPRLIGAALLGLGASAFFWLPAIAESGYTVVDAVLGGRSTILLSLAEWPDLVQPWVALDYYGDQRFRFALVGVIVCLAAIAVLPFQTPRFRGQVAPLAIAAVIMLMLQSRASEWFWTQVPVVRFIQFAWRLSGLVSLCVAVLAGSLLQMKGIPSLARRASALALVALLFAASWWNLSPDKARFWYAFSSEDVGDADIRYRGSLGFPVYADFMPKWVGAESKSLAQANVAAAAHEDKASAFSKVEVLEETLTSLHLRVRASEAASLSLHKFYFPGWHAAADGKPVPVDPAGPLGLVGVAVPQGEYDVQVSFGETELRNVADACSVLAVCVMAVGLAGASGRRRGLAAVVVVLVLVAAALFWRGYQVENWLARPVAATASFDGQIELTGYRMDRATVRAGETVRLRLYWFVREAPGKDYKVFLHLVKPGQISQLTQSDSEPLSGYGHTSWWQAGELVPDEHSWTIDPAVPPGEYEILAGLYEPGEMRDLGVVSPDRLRAPNRVVLTQLTVTQ